MSVPDHRPARVAVVGGGVAGLAAAHFLGQGVEVVVLEGQPDVGGKLAAAIVAGVSVDGGAESLLARRPEAVDLARSLGLELCSPAVSSAGVWTRRRVRPLPPTYFGVPTDLKALRRSRVLSARGLARVRLDRVLPRQRAVGDVAVGALVSERLGREVRDRLVDPFLGGVYAGNADRLSLRATLPALAARLADDRSLLHAAGQAAGATGSGPVFAGVTGGVARLAPALVAASGARVRTRAMVRVLGRAPDGGWRAVVGNSGPGVSTGDESLDVDAVVVAVPTRPASRLLRGVAPRAAAELARVEYASSAVVTLAFPVTSWPRLPVLSGYLVPARAGRITKAVTFSSVKWGWLRSAAPDVVIVRCSVGRYGEEAVLQRADDELVAATAAELGEAAGVVGPPVDAVVTRWGGGLPQYAVGHLDRVAAIRSAVGEHPGLAVCGAAYDGVGVAACVASARTAAERVLRHLRRAGTMVR